MIAAPTMRVPMLLKDSVNPYLAMRAVLLLLKHGSFAAGRNAGRPVAEVVKRVAVPGFGTGVGRVSARICARQMHQAVRDFLGDAYVFPSMWNTASEKHQLLYTDRPRDLQYPE